MGLFRAPPPGRRATPGRVGRVGEDLDPTPLSFGCSISLSLSLSLVVVVVVVVERELYQTTPYSLSLCVCVCVCVLPSMSSSILAPSLKLLPQTLHSSRVRLPPLSRSVCFGLFCVVCFRSMSLPRFGNLWIFPSYHHLGRRTSRRVEEGTGHRRRRSRTW